MIKLKIGDNYLLTTYKDRNHALYIKYMMSCFEDNNKVAVGLYSLENNPTLYDNYIKGIVEARPKELYILSYMGNRGSYYHGSKKILTYGRFETTKKIGDFISVLKNNLPEPIKIKVIKIDDAITTKKFRLADRIYSALELDDKSIINKLPYLDDYKEFSTRYKNIPAELKVINESIKKLSKEKKVNDKQITLNDLGYLNLIDEVELDGRNLILTIKPLSLFPSEKFGDLYTENEFRENKYLYNATKYLYQGCNFGMVGTKISIDPTFTPRFIDTLNHDFDDMFSKSNWSNIGYLHFGKGHLCGGEFNNVIAHAAEHGMEYYFLCLKQYITTGNVRDYAGQKIWWYPIYDETERLVYCAGLDILRDTIISRNPNNRELKDKLLSMNFDEFLQWKKDNGISFHDYSFNRYESSSTSTSSPTKGVDRFLKVVQEKEPELYNELKKGAM